MEAPPAWNPSSLLLALLRNSCLPPLLGLYQVCISRWPQNWESPFFSLFSLGHSFANDAATSRSLGPRKTPDKGIPTVSQRWQNTLPPEGSLHQLSLFSRSCEFPAYAKIKGCPQGPSHHPYPTWWVTLPEASSPHLSLSPFKLALQTAFPFPSSTEARASFTFIAQFNGPLEQGV